MYKFNELKHLDTAIDYLAKSLNNGELILFLGAGTSIGFGLPSWSKLVNSMRKELILEEVPDGAGADDLQSAADEMIDILGSKAKLVDLVQKHLYQDVQNLIENDVFQNHLLIAISSLLMGSKRGHVTRVVTLNYDNMLEWFLSLFGFLVKTIYELPALDGSEDVRIYHPHGFVPHPSSKQKKSDFVILGMDEINKRLGTPNDPWFEMTRHLLHTGICLFIGMSGKTLIDRALAPLFITTAELVKNSRPVGLWIFMDDLTKPKEAEFARHNVVPLVIRDPRKISEFLLQICQSAMRKIIS